MDAVEILNREGAIQIYTDGSCLGNPGPGGWAYIIRDGGTRQKGTARNARRPTTVWS